MQQFRATSKSERYAAFPDFSPSVLGLPPLESASSAHVLGVARSPVPAPRGRRAVFHTPLSSTARLGVDSLGHCRIVSCRRRCVLVNTALGSCPQAMNFIGRRDSFIGVLELLDARGAERY
jgi:hypothetical protein